MALNFVACLCISLQFHLSHSSSPPRLLIGVHPLDEVYYEAEVIECKDGSKWFARDRLNDNFCDCADGTDEPGTSACPASRFYCRNMGSTPRYLFSSRVNDKICDCCDGSDEYDGTVSCPDTCVRGGNIVYQKINYDSGASKRDSLNSRKNQHGIETVDATHKPVDATHKPSGLKALIFIQMALVFVLVAFLIFPQRKTRRANRQ